MEIDWSNPDNKVSKYFTVHECLWLPTWSRHATEADGLTQEVKQNLVSLCEKMDLVREFLNGPIQVHVTFRPEEYNKLVGGAKKSAHKSGMAMDWHCVTVACDTARERLKPKLEEWNLRMEDLPGSGWVHIDITAPNPNRFFKP